jgi:hypothetical protein
MNYPYQGFHTSIQQRPTIDCADVGFHIRSTQPTDGFWIFLYPIDRLCPLRGGTHTLKLPIVRIGLWEATWELR